MGAHTAQGMAEAVHEGWIGFHQAIGWHLQHNHYPPVPESMVDPCIAALVAVADNESEQLVELPDPVTWRGRTSAPAWAIVEGHHLLPFIDAYEDAAGLY